MHTSGNLPAISESPFGNLHYRSYIIEKTNDKVNESETQSKSAT